MNPQISKKITERIKKENIKPSPKWHFLFKNGVFWFLFAISIILGSLAFSIVIFEFSESEVNLFGRLSFADLVINYLPIFWFLFLSAFIGLAYYGAKHTKKGYKFSPLLLLFSSVAISSVLGILIFAFGVAEKTEDVFARNIKIYKGLHERKQDIWMRTEKGLLAGEILSIDKEKKIIVLKDFEGIKWSVDFNNTPKIPEFIFQNGMKVRIVGKKTDKNNFVAVMIKPWVGMREEKMRNMIRQEDSSLILPPPRMHEINKP